MQRRLTPEFDAGTVRHVVAVADDTGVVITIIPAVACPPLLVRFDRRALQDALASGQPKDGRGRLPPTE